MRSDPSWWRLEKYLNALLLEMKEQNFDLNIQVKSLQKEIELYQGVHGSYCEGKNYMWSN